MDHEEKSEHEIVLTLTDGQLGDENYITQSLLIIVLDENDNPPVFSQPQTSVTVPENTRNKVGSKTAMGQLTQTSQLKKAVIIYCY